MNMKQQQKCNYYASKNYHYMCFRFCDASDGKGNMCSRTVRKLAEMMENLLSILTSRSAELAGDVLLKLIERVPDVKEKVVCAFVEN